MIGSESEIIMNELQDPLAARKGGAHETRKLNSNGSLPGKKKG